MIIFIIISLIGYVLGLYLGFNNFSIYHGPNSNIIKKIEFIENKNNTLKRFKYIPVKIKN